MACNLKEQLKTKRFYFEGAMGTMLQEQGLQLGEIPELLNISNPNKIEQIHKAYLEAGATILSTNTFGANRFKVDQKVASLEDLITQAVEIAKRARGERTDVFIALDVGSTGRVIKPVGDTDFEEVYEAFREQMQIGKKVGVDAILIETMTDLYEVKAAVLAAKETNLPIFCTMSFDTTHHTFFGTSLESMVLLLEGLNVDALGINCSLGPKELLPLVKDLMQLTHIPVIIQPNAGLPHMSLDGKTTFDITPEVFSDIMVQFAQMGVTLLGGCCGTTPEHIRQTIEKTKPLSFKLPNNIKQAGICSSSQAVYFNDICIIGERINPTGKKVLQSELRKHHFDYVAREALKQVEQGATLLDVNMGMPDMDETTLLTKAILEIQSVVTAPLMIDSSNVAALEAAVRLYNGKPLINSVNGKEESLKAILLIAKKYGAAILGLTLDERGIPKTAEERLQIATRIVEAAKKIGIPREDVFIDCLTITASAQQDEVKETLKAIRLIKETLSVKTILGVSNVSFGLPNRSLMNRTMLAMALMQGLDAPIMNPNDQNMIETVAAYRVLAGLDKDGEQYLQTYSQKQVMPLETGVQNDTIDLKVAIQKGLKEEAIKAVQLLKQTYEPLTIIENEIIPALNQVGIDYEQQVIFLPQLIKSSEAAKSAFDSLSQLLLNVPKAEQQEKQKIILATVHGDVHDIGKNIVKVIMENYNFEVVDLGKDVPKEAVIKAAVEHQITLIGLSALMTTTVGSMKDTIKALREQLPKVTVIVGGAVLTSELASYVDADFYAKDAMETVRIAREVYKE